MFEKLEYKYGKYAITNLPLYMSIIYLVGLLMFTINPLFYYAYLSLDISKLFMFQFWRIVTFMFFPPGGTSNILFSLLFIYIYYSLTKSLLYMWSDFKLNLFFLFGIFFHVIGGIIAYLVTKENIVIFPTYLTFSLYIAFALTFPDAQFFLYFFIPIKAKYFAVFEIIIYIINFISSSFSSRLCILFSLLNVFIFMFAIHKENIIWTIKNFFRNLKK